MIFSLTGPTDRDLSNIEKIIIFFMNFILSCLLSLTHFCGGSLVPDEDENREKFIVRRQLACHNAHGSGILLSQNCEAAACVLPLRGGGLRSRTVQRCRHTGFAEAERDCETFAKVKGKDRQHGEQNLSPPHLKYFISVKLTLHSCVEF